jgi:hypothetical protein
MRRRETVVFTLIIFSMALIGRYFADHPQAPQTAAENDTMRLSALVGSAENGTLKLDTAQKNSDCSVVGPLPDHACTPGSVFDNASTSTICVSGYTKTVRNVPVRVKKQVYANYGIPYPEPSGSYELDHLISLELGGDNSVANLFPEAASPAPGFHEKDIVENYLHEKVCSGGISLPAAQKQIADNWLAVYDLLSSSTVERLKAKYPNWSE